jgi:hypothetical protein
MRRPLGCMTFSALVAAVLVGVAILIAAVASGNGIFSPGQLSAVANGGPLGGVSSHADLAGRCDACHPAALSSGRMGELCLACHSQVQQEIASKAGLHGRLLATTTNCRDCHTDHRGATAALTLADPRVFPHEQTGYALTAHPLSGQGGSFGCRDCHPGSPVSFSAPTCAACHQSLDAPFMAQHTATFGTTCLACHDGVDSYGKAFDHATYPLSGGHEQVQCGACHQGATTIAALRATSTECVACHAARDIHEGRLGTSCAECHSTATWTDATIDHDRTRYALVGRHVGTACESCHVDRHWTGIGLSCRSCHTKDDPHGGQFAGDCAACHAATGWKDVTFDHAQTGFALDGGHAKPTCAACHANGVYKGTPKTCIGCHAGDDQHRGSLGRDCASCHGTKAWLPASFDHARSSYPLTGAHLSVTCQKCHVGGVYKGTPKTCAACHTKPASHGSAYGTSCASCHATKAWLPASFSGPHAFPRTHGGAGGTCSSCHPSSWTSYSCARCHADSSMTQRHREVSRFSLTTCATCHPNGKGD